MPWLEVLPADAPPVNKLHCIYSPAFKQFVYRKKLVDRMVEGLDMKEKYQRLIGRSPIAKAVAEEVFKS